MKKSKKVVLGEPLNFKTEDVVALVVRHQLASAAGVKLVRSDAHPRRPYPLNPMWAAITIEAGSGVMLTYDFLTDLAALLGTPKITVISWINIADCDTCGVTGNKIGLSVEWVQS